MTRRRLLLAVATLLVVVGLVLWWPRGEEHPPGPFPLRLDAVGGELLLLDASAVTRRGPGRVWALRLERGAEFVPYHFASAGLSAPQPIEQWATHLDAPVVFNAGQFDEKLNHLGWLKGEGVWLSELHRKQWLALLVSGPLDGPPWSGIIDLEQSNPRIVDRYRHAVQSMMLFDERGRVRVRESDLSACRTLIAEDGDGRLVILVSEGAMTLGDVARWLPGAGLDLVRAMNLDGGIEAQLAVRTPELSLAIYGQYGTGTTVFDGGGQIRYPLPAVIAVRRPGSAR